VRTRMPGGVAGERPLMADPYADSISFFLYISRSYPKHEKRIFSSAGNIE